MRKHYVGRTAGWVAAVVVAAGLGGGAKAADVAPLPVTIGIQADADWLTPAAQEFKLFEKVGLTPKFVKFTAGAPMMAAAQSQSIDVATPGLVPFLAGIGQGIPWVTIGINPIDPTAEGFVVRKGAGIKTLADLKGKRIGFFRASTAHYALFVALEQNHISPDQVTLLSMAPAQQVAAMRNGEIDAAVVWEPWMHKLVADANGEVLKMEGDIGVDTADGTYAVRKEWLATHRETARRLIEAIVLAYDALGTNTEPVIKGFAEATGIQVDWSAEIYKEGPPPDVRRWADPTYKFSVAKGGPLQHQLALLSTFLAEQKVTPTPVDVSDVLDDSIIKEVLAANPTKR